MCELDQLLYLNLMFVTLNSNNREFLSRLAPNAQTI